MVYHLNKQNYTIKKFNNENIKDVACVLNLVKENFFNVFFELKSDILKYGPVNTPALENGLFVENENGKKVGCVLFGARSCNVPIIEYKPNTLFVHYLMVNNKYRNLGLGSKLLRGVIDYARQNNYDYIELINSYHVFKTIGNIYENNNFNKINMHTSLVDPLRQNFIFRINTNQFILNISDYLFDEVKKQGLSNIDEQKLIEGLLQKYNDVILSETKSEEFLLTLTKNLKKYKECKSAKKVSAKLKTKQTLNSLPLPNKNKVSSETYNRLIQIFDVISDKTLNNNINKKLEEIKKKNM